MFKSLTNVFSRLKKRTDESSSRALTEQLQDEIKRRAEVERELLREREETQLILDSIPSLIFLKNTENGIRRINRAAENSIGRKRCDVEGRHSREIFPEMADKYHTDDLQVIESDTAKLGYVQQIKDRWVRTDKIPFRGESGSVSGILVVATDITAEKNAEEMIQLAFDATPTGLMTVDQHQQIVTANSSVAEIFGYEPGELVGKPIETLIPERFRAAHGSHFQQFANAPSHRAMGVGRELAGLRSNGDEFPIEISIRPIQTASGPHVLASVVDVSERNAREAKLTRYAELVEKTSQMARVGGWEVDVATQQVTWSDEVCRIHDVAIGYHPEINEAINFYSDEAKPLIVAAIEVAQTELRGWDLELQLVTATGKRKWVRAIGEPRVVDGAVVALTGTFQDINSRKRTEQALQLTQATVDQALDAIMFFREDGSIQYANDQASTFLRYSAEELASVTAAQIDTRHAGEAWNKHWDAVEAAGDLIENSEHTRSDGTTYECEIRCSYRKIDGQELLVYIVHDTTAANRERALRDTLFEGTVTGHMMFNQNGVIECNAALVSMFRVATKADLIGRDPTDFLPEFQPNGHRSLDMREKTIEEVFRTGQARLDWNYRREDGTEFPAEVTVRVVNLESGPAILVDIYDITERHQAETAIRRSNEDLTQFAYVASHDLQAPLRGVAGFAEFLQADYAEALDETANGYIKHIVAGCDRMSQLIQDLLEFSRVGRTTAEFKPSDLNQVLDDVLDTLSTEIGEADISIKRNSLPTCNVDAGQITRVFENLIGNAIKYRGDEKPEVRIQATPTPDAWQIEISDNGIGIEQKHQTKVFDIFQRLHGQEAYPGTGIGLSICRKIVERHKGRIWLDSEPGRGTTFYFTLSK